jgi:hypothetical protein
LDIDPTFGEFFTAKYSEQLKLKIVEQYQAGAVRRATLDAA